MPDKPETDKARRIRQHLDAANVGTAVLVLEETSLSNDPDLEPIILKLREIWKRLESTKSL